MLTINATSLRASLNDAIAPSSSGRGADDPAGFASLLRLTQTQAQPPERVPEHAPAPAPTAKPPAPQPGSAMTDPADDPVTEATAPRPAPGQAAADAAHAAERADAQTSDDAALANDPTNRTRALLKGRTHDTDAAAARRAGKPATRAVAAAGGADGDAAANAAAATAQASPADATATPGAPLDPAVQHWLAGLQRADTAAAGTEAATSIGAAPRGRTTAADARNAAAWNGTQAVATDASAADAIGASAMAGKDAADKSANHSLRTDVATSGVPLAQVLAETASHETLLPASLGSVSGMHEAALGLAAASAAAGATTGSTTTTAQAPAPTVLTMATKVDAPEFPQALGLQMSVLARDGIQHAELHLNPAEMGPVTVNIAMDGTQARVDFGADVAATRQAIEAGLPELASALRDAGFTLAGGGVSQNARGRDDGSGSGDGSGASPGGGRRRQAALDGAATGRIASAPRRTVSAGGVDLYA